MKNLHKISICLLLFIPIMSHSAIYYVGDENDINADCDGSNHYSNLSLALLAGIINGTQADEIRLTNTVSYTGSVNGSYTLSNWRFSENGELTIIGGYEKCSSANSNGTTIIGEDTDTAFSIINDSTVTLKNITIQNSEQYGVTLTQNSLLFLESVTIKNNLYNGIYVDGAAAVFIDEESMIHDNGMDYPNSGGGGVHCRGVSSAVYLSGTLRQNYGNNGANLHIADGCYGQLNGGSRISSLFSTNVIFGGGVYVGNEAWLYSFGGNERVVIANNYASYGGAISVQGTGRATLNNTYITGNKATVAGSGIYASGGGSTNIQVEIDRRQDCPFLISCSEFEDNDIVNSLIHIQSSRVRINRTIFEKNTFDEDSSPIDIRSLIKIENGGILEMSHSNFLSNEIQFLIHNEGKAELSHVTGVNNTYPADVIGDEYSFVWAMENGELRIENSIFQNTQGGFNAPNSSPIIAGKCNLIDEDQNWPAGSYHVGTAFFNNVISGDARQQPGSDGVDMCREDTFAWSENIDIEYQTTPVNEDTNPQGNPGENGGFYDAGFDEVYANLGEYDLIYKNGFESNSF